MDGSWAGGSDGHEQEKGRRHFYVSSGSQIGKIWPLSEYLVLTIDIFVTARGLLLASGRKRPGMLPSIPTMHMTVLHSKELSSLKCQ